MRRLLAILLVVAVLCACSKSSSGYGRGTEAAFMETCTVHEQQPQAICSCIYEEITQQIPYDRYVELDKQMQTDDKFVPDELVSISADCSTRLTSTTTTSTAPPPSSSSTTSSTSSSTSSSSTSSSSGSTTSSVDPLGF
jgi:hypothetical protein